MLINRLKSFTDREEVITNFVELLNSAQCGQFYLLAIKGNSGTGKTFLIEYLSRHICPKINWHSGQFSLAQSAFDFRSFFGGLETALKDCVPNAKFKEYCNKRDEYNRSFSEYRASINVYQSANAEENSSISNNSFEATINIQLRDRERQLFSEWSRALIKLAEGCEKPLCLFADNYLSSLETSDKHYTWLGGDLLPRIAKSSPHPMVFVICGWNWPTSEVVDPLHVQRFELKDFNPVQISDYLEKRQISHVAETPQHPRKDMSELVQTLYELTKGHPLVLDIAVTLFDGLEAHERFPQVLNAKRPLMDEKARVDFLEERLLARLSEPFRTLLERGPILRIIGQEELQQLLNVQINGMKHEAKNLSDRDYEHFLQFPFVSLESISKGGFFEVKPLFHDIVRKARLEALRRLHPQTKKMLHISMMNYYQNAVSPGKNDEYSFPKLTKQERKLNVFEKLKLLFSIGQNRKEIEEEKIETVETKNFLLNVAIEDAENKHFSIVLEGLYHALQIEEYQEDTFYIWVTLVGRAVVLWRHQQARLLLALIEQLSKEGEPFLRPTSSNYASYLVWYGRLLDRESRWSEGIEVLEEAAKIFEEHQNYKYLSTCFNLMSTLFIQQGELEQGLNYSEKSLNASTQNGNDGDNVSYLVNTGMVYQIRGNLEKALKQYEQALTLLSEQETYNVAICLDNIGNVHQLTGDLEKALNYHEKAKAIFEELGLQTKIAMCLNQIGEIYRQQGEQEKALANHKQALSIVESVNDDANIAIALNNIGCDYDYVGNSDMAINYFNQALAIHEQINSPINIATTLNNIGLSYCSRYKWEEALECFIRGLEFVEKVGDIHTIAHCYNNIGLVYFHQKKFDEAMIYYTKALRLREQIGDSSLIAQTIHNIGDIYVMKNMYGKANEQFVKALNFYRSAGRGYEFDVADELESLALYNGLLGQQNLAKEYLAQAQEIRAKMKGVTRINYIGPQLPFQLSHAVLQQLIHSEAINLQQKSQGQASKKKREKVRRKRHR